MSSSSGRNKRQDRAGAGFSTDTFDQNPLTLNASAPPVLGTTIQLTTTDEPVLGGIGLLIFSVNPNPAGIPGILWGAPGCTAYVTTIDVTTVLISPVQMQFGLPIPNDPNIVGLKLGCQSAWIDPSQNAIGIVTSNLTELTMGN